jgi:selT/selW/selH-like putative selenoprotein
LAAKITKELNAEVELEKSSGGAFEVFKDGRQVFSKLNEGRFPEDEEVIDLLK